MYCTNCGKELEDGLKFCTECGTPVFNTEPVPAAAPEAPVVLQFAQQPYHANNDQDYLRAELEQAYADHARGKSQTGKGTAFAIIAAVCFTAVGIFSGVVEANVFSYVLSGTAWVMIVIDFLILFAGIGFTIPALICLIKGGRNRAIASNKISALKAQLNLE